MGSSEIFNTDPPDAPLLHYRVLENISCKKELVDSNNYYNISLEKKFLKHKHVHVQYSYDTIYE